MIHVQRTHLSKGDLKWIWILFLPLVGTSITNYAFHVLEKLFLTRVSQVALEAALNATIACQIFQAASISLVMMAQVYVGRWYGGRIWTMIGPGIWQFIWFSFLSMIITVPGSLCYGIWYFHGTEIESAALPYFYLFTFFNFLYPLGASLTCFFLGQGKTRFILFASIVDQILKIGLAYLLIFGIDPFLPGMGMIGGAISSLTAQAIFCIILGIVFLKKNHRETFHSHRWKLDPLLFWECIKPGLFRGLNRVLSFASWACIAHLMAIKGGDYLLILSIGGSLNLFSPFLFEAIYQTQTTIVSQMIGAKNFTNLFAASRSSLILVLCFTCLIGIPFLLFSQKIFTFLFPGIAIDIQTIQNLFCGIWLWFFYFTFAAIPLSYILAFKDLKFYSFVGAIFWITDYLLMYFFIEKIQIPANLFWIVLSLVQMASTIPIYFWRMSTLCKQAQLRQSDVDQLTMTPHPNLRQSSRN
jgi:multidrug resistance protein, MATE family